jgi:hypothetical protein
MANSLQILKVDSSNILTYKVKLLQSFSFHNDAKRAERERGLLVETIKLVQKEKTVLYLLEQDEKPLGMVALSASSIDDSPVIQIDFLFVDYQYRKIILENSNTTIAKYLILFAIQLSEKIKQEIGLRHLVLYPDAQSDKLINYYKEMGFEQLNKYWLFIKLQ